jgi:hypothetical protein
MKFLMPKRVTIPDGATVIKKDEVVALNEYIRVSRRIIAEVMCTDSVYFTEELKDALEGYYLFVEEFDLRR